MRDRPAESEIEVTPEMMDAGAELLSAFDGGYFDGTHEYAAQIFSAMWRAKEASGKAGRVPG